MSIEVTHDLPAEHWDWPLQHHDGVVKVHDTPEHFEVGFDVQFFTPKEIELQAHENHLSVHCSHDVRQDKHGDVKREISRSYKLPEDVDVSTIKSHLTKNGILYVSAAKKRKQPAQPARTIEVTHNWAEGEWEWPLQHHDGVVKVHDTPEFFEVGLDAGFFTPKEIEVQAVDGHLRVHFYHEARTDEEGDVQREITRTYKLPEGIDPSTLKTHLTKRGVLYISATKAQ
ncbi:HSP-12.2 protein [Aphelenchoides avenae]|nr:HSP-12.2 protein [Aphelenchus avenae]